MDAGQEGVRPRAARHPASGPPPLRVGLHWTGAIGIGVVLAVAGCGSSPAAPPVGPGQGPTVIRVAYWGGPEEIDIIQGLIADWRAAHPDVVVHLEHTPFSAYVSRLLTRMAGNVSPDIMAVEVNLFPTLWSKGAFLSLQPFIDRDHHFNLQEFFPEVVEHFSVDGQVYAIPRDTAPFACVYYNKRLFDEAHLAYPTDD